MKRAAEHKRTVVIAKTHGVWAEPTTLAHRLLNILEVVGVANKRLRSARDEIKVCKISGFVGTFSNIDPRIQELVAKQLDLKPVPIATQIVNRVTHVSVTNALADMAGAIEHLALQIWLGHQDERHEIREPFTEGQTGSSFGPHKQNANRTERLRGMAALVRGQASAYGQLIATPDERGIEQSSVERTAVPLAFCFLDYMLEEAADLVSKMVVDEQRIAENIERTQGRIATGYLRVAAEDKGMQDAYKVLQKLAQQSYEANQHMRDLVLGNDELMNYLTPEDVEACFDYWGKLREPMTLIYHRFRI